MILRMRLALLALLVACGGDRDDTAPTGPSDTTAPAPEPGPLHVGLARVRMPVPLGIGTVGYGGFVVPADPSPFAEIYPATTRIHGHPDIRAMVLSRGEGFEVVFLRLDTVGVFQQVRRALVLELKERLGRDLDHALVVSATHTHSGPGRVIDAGGLFDLIADTFFPEFYANLVDAMADAVEQAYADLAPGRLGTGLADASTAIDDRRCADGLDYVNGTAPILAVEQEGRVTGVLTAFAIHGTVLGIEDLTLSQDVSGAIEAAIEDRWGHPITAIMLNSWGADMSPGDPGLPLQDGAAQPDGYDKMEEIGQAVADAIAAVELTWTDAPELSLRTHRVPLGREAIGYDEDTFLFEWGGVYCGTMLEADCDASTSLEPVLDDACIPFNADYPAPRQTELSVGQVGPYALVTFPGEPGTLLAERVVSDVQARGAEDVLFVGYAQDYIGYSILEDDWWQGGYEAGGSLWGPQQGEYLVREVAKAWDETFGGAPQEDEPEPIAPFDDPVYDPWVATPPVDAGAIVTDVPATVGPTEVVTFVIAGLDPWLGAPIAHLEDEGGAPVLRPGGHPVTSEGVAFWLDLTTEPTYAETLEAPARRFLWHVRLPVRHEVPGAVPELAGRYRLRVVQGSLEVTSGVFEVVP